ncbi:MAG: hypothetical protein K8T10_18415 [Candidatus Eremiobacteraeota bacterium]|nr:hypothetical protein [Candidatus Eremiobacteraeota bacterium]
MGNDISVEKEKSIIKDIIVDPYKSSAFSSLTIGLPFCVFKFLFGILILRNHIKILGWIFIVWAIIDFIMNSIRIKVDLVHRRPAMEYCLLAQIGKVIFKKTNLFLAVDTFLSFGIICFALWSGWIKELRPWEAYTWYAATTLNLLSLALVNIHLELKRKK